MSHFLGTHTNRIDAKGRVSIPAPFRTALRALAVEGAAPLVLRTSHKHACIECWPSRFFEDLAPPLEKMDIFDDDHDDLAMALYPDAAHFDPDKEGRIGLPEDLIRHAGLGETVFFMGLGRTFQIWEPLAAERARAAARERARFKHLTLRSASASPAPVPAEAP
jgi:MraZ protein